MKHIALLLSFVTATAPVLHAQEAAKSPPAAEKSASAPKLAWLEDFEAAKKQASERKLDLFLNFTGSDWCSFCVQLKREVFDQPAFAEAAKDKAVFVEVDFPQEKKLDPKLAAQNEELEKKYKIEGYPTILLADATGKPYAKTGYEHGGVEGFLGRLAEFQQVRMKRDEFLEKAKAQEGVEKAKTLKSALDTMEDEVVEAYYTAEVDQIIALDAEDTLGLKKEREYSKAIAKLEESMDLDKPQDWIAAVDAFIAGQKPTGDKLQAAMMMKFQAYADDLDGAEKLLREIIKVDEASAIAADSQNLIEVIRDLKAQNAAEKKPK